MIAGLTREHRLLASSSAFRIIGELRNGPRSASEVADRLSMTDSAVRLTLNELKTAGLVETRKVKTKNRKPATFYEITREVGLALTPPSYTADVLVALVRGFGEEFGKERVKETSLKISASLGKERIRSLIGDAPRNELSLKEFVQAVLKGHGRESLTEVSYADDGNAVLLRDHGCPGRFFRENEAEVMCDYICAGFDQGMGDFFHGRFTVERTRRPDSDHPFCDFRYSQRKLRADPV